MSDAAARIAETSAFAVKYGVANRPQWLRDASRSGVTPTFQPPDPGISTQQKADYYGQDLFQRETLFSFSTWELDDQGTLCYPGSKPDTQKNDLKGNLHPLVHRDRWINPLPNYTYDVGGRSANGRWAGDNDEVWAILEPILRLVSAFIQNVHRWPWFDALIFGVRRPVPDEDIDDDGNDDELQTFHLRTPKQADAAKEKLKKYFLDISKRIKFMIGTATERPNGQRSTGVLAATYGYQKGGGGIARVRISISWQYLEPLRRFELSAEETVCHQFNIAKTIFHELGHAMEKLRPEFDLGYEPFFEREEVCEIGRSLENAVFGGVVRKLGTSYDVNPSPSLGAFTVPWPDWKFYYQNGKANGNQRKGKSDRFGDGATCDLWPITIEKMEQLGRNEFWTDAVAKFGPSVVRPMRVCGHRITKSQQPFSPLDFDVLEGSSKSDWEQRKGKRIRALDGANASPTPIQLLAATLGDPLLTGGGSPGGANAAIAFATGIPPSPGTPPGTVPSVFMGLARALGRLLG